MTRACLRAFAALLLVTGCGGGTSSGDAGPEAVCEDAESLLELSCPAAVDLGCIPAEGVPAVFAEVTAIGCDGSVPAVVCDPGPDERLLPGETRVTCTASIAGGIERSCEFAVTAERAGGFSLECAPDPIAAECAGATTPTAVPAPIVVEDCGRPAGVPVSDAPPEGYPPGETVVTFTGNGEDGFAASCSVTVEISDSVPPAIACPPALTLARTSPEESAVPPPVTAVDACDGEIPATAAPAVLPRGVATVTYTATDAAGLEASCGAEVAVLDLFAVEGLRIVSAHPVGAEGTSVTLAWEPSAGADAGGYRVERGASEEGPWTALAALGPWELVHTDPDLPGPRAYYRVVTTAGEVDGGVAGPIRAFAIRTAAYDLRNVAVPGIPFPTTLYGVVRHPLELSAGPFPLVAFLHGNHGNCRPSPFTSDDDCVETNDHDCHRSGYTTTPNAEGLAYLGETLAAQGYVAFSISGNAVNCRDDYIAERASLILEHLRRWREWATTGGDPFGTRFAGAVDLDRVGLVGHSRGGEAVAHVPSRLAASPIPGMTLRSVFSIAPTDYHTPTPSGSHYAVLLPSCDGDVYTLVGMNIYDRALDVSDPSVRSQVFFVGANHNFFSTEWRYDDNRMGLVCAVRDEVGAEVQQHSLEAVLGAWFNGSLAAGGSPEPFLRADADTPLGIDAWAGRDLDLRWSHAAAARTVIDDFGGAGAPDTNRLGLANTSAGTWSVRRACYENGCDRDFDHEKSALFLSWDGTAPSASFDLGSLDATAMPYLSFRVVSRRSTLNTGTVAQDFVMRLADADGTAVEMLLSDVRRVPHLYPTNMPREILQTVRIPLAAIARWNPAFDPGALARFDLEMGIADHARGSVLVTDVEIAR